MTTEDGGIVLRWSAPADDGGSRILRYQMRNAEGASVPADRPWISTGRSTSGAFRRLTNGTLYSFEVRAVNAEGDGPAAQIQATPGFAPAAPRNLTAKAGHSYVKLVWDAPADSGSTAITDYEYRYAEGATVPSGTTWRSAGNGLSEIVGSLTNGTAHAFELRAVNGVGGGDAATATATPMQHPTVTIRPDRVAYSFAEDASGASVTIVAQAEPGGRRPFLDIYVSVSTREVSGGANLPADYAPRSVTLGIGPEDFSEVGGVWQARKSVALSIVDDSEDEDDETLRVLLEKSPGFPPWAQIREADGTTACKADRCRMTVTIEDNDSVASAPQRLAAMRGEGEVTLTWTAPDDPGTSAIDGYEYRHAEGSTLPEDTDKTKWTSAGTALTATVQSLTNGTEYAFEVRAVSAAGKGAAAATTATPGKTVPSVPRDVVVTTEDGGIVLRWSAPADDGGSRILRYQMRNAEGASVPADRPWISTGRSTSGAFRRLTNGTLYSFEVRAVNAEGDGPAAQIQATPGFAPAAPRNLTAKAGHGSVSLIWDAPADSGSTEITDYEIRYAEGATVPSGTTWRSAGNGLSETVGSLANGTAYAFELRAVNGVGGGDAATATATPMQHPTVTIRPDRVAYSFAEDASGASVTIVAQAEPGGRRPFLDIYVSVSTREVSGGANTPADYAPRSVTLGISPEDFSEVGGVWQARKSVALSIVDDSADEDDETLRVLLEKSPGFPPWAQIREADGTTACKADRCRMTVTIEDNDSVASAPQSLAAMRGEGEVTLTWAAPDDPGTSAIDGYEYRHAEGSTVPEDTDKTKWTSAGTALTATVQSLTNGTEYAFEVRAVSAAGKGAAAATTATPGTTVPSVPRDVVVTAEDGGIVLRWSAPADDGGSRILRYQMRNAEGASVPADRPWISTGRSTSGAFRRLTNGTLYSFEVLAVNAEGDGPAAQIQATPGLPPSAPRNLTGTPADGEVELRWQAPADDGGADIARYEVRHAEGASIPDDTVWTPVGLATAHTVSKLTNGTSYAFEVRAVSDAAAGSAAATTGTPATVPGPPRNFSTTPADGEVTLAWQTPASDGGSAITSYEYRHGEGASVPSQTAWEHAGTSLTATVGTLTNGTQYAFEVRAVNNAGEGEAATVTATPREQATAPSAPRNLAATPGHGQVGLGWETPADPGTSAITGYEVRHAEGASVPSGTTWQSVGTNLNALFGSLTHGTQYAFEVRAVSSAGGGHPAAVTATPVRHPTVIVRPELAANRITEGTVGAGVVIVARTGAGSGRPFASFAVSVSSTAGPDGATSGSDYEPVETVILFQPEDFSAVEQIFEARKTVVLTIPDDAAAEAAEDFSVRIGKGESVPDWLSFLEADGTTACGADGCLVTVTITDNDRVASVPQNLVAILGDGEVTLAWEAPADAGTSAITGYEYRHAEGTSVPQETLWNSAGMALTVTVGSLANGKEYAFEVRAVNAAGMGDAATAMATPAPRIRITPVPPEASADHGPFYPTGDFLAVPDGVVHGRGDTLTFTLNHDTEVTVTGAPELVLDIYGRERRARYTGGSGTTQLTFDWTVATGDNDPDGLAFVSLDLNGGTIRDTGGIDFGPQTIPAQHFALHRVRGGLNAMRLEVSGSAREGEPFEIRVIRDGGYDEPALAVVTVTDSALPHVAPWDYPESNGPGVRQFGFHDGESSEPGVRVSTLTVTPLGDGVADSSRTLTVHLAATEAGIYGNTGQRIRAWYLAEEPLEVMVPVIDTGQPPAESGLRVHQTSTTEAPGAKLVFRVSLSPHSDSPVTVEYRTGDDRGNERNATAGEDYVATEGTLTFEPGETLKTVEVDVLVDDHDDSFETMRLILSNAQGARIDKASALGVITNDGPIPRAWLGRFGRTVADQVLDAVESRMWAARKPGVEMTIAGQRGGSGAGSGEQGPDGDPGAANLSGWLQSGHDPLWGDDGHGWSPALFREVTTQDLLGGTSFNVTAEAGRGGYISLWGRGVVTRFDGREDELTLDGEVSSAMIGADWTREDWTAGLIVSRSDAKGGYEGHSGGRVAATLTGLYPWGRLALSDSVDAWGAAGYGTGELTVTPRKPGTDENGATVRTDLDLRMATAGLRGALVDGGGDGLSLTGKTDALIVHTASDAARGPDGGSLATARATVTRLRLGLEAERPVQLGGGGMLTPSVEVGVRRDGGDAETGFGVDVGGGIAWSLPTHDLQLELRGRGLLTHEAEDFRERGFSGSLSWDPHPASDRGPRASFTQTLGGSPSGGMNAVLSRGTLSGLAANDNSDDQRRLEARFGYGFAAFGDRFTSLPEIALGLSNTGRDYSLGWRLVRGSGFGSGTLALSVEARRRETANDDIAPEHQVGFRIDARF